MSPVTRTLPSLLLCLVLAATAGACGDGGGDGRADRVRPDATTTEVPSPLPTTTSSSATPSRSATSSPGPGPTSVRPSATAPTASGTGPRSAPSTTHRPASRSAAPPTVAPTTARPTAADLTRALLSTAQLPAGYVKTILKNDPPTRSSRPDCVQRLNSLEIHRTTAPGSVEARVAFAQSSSGPFLQQVLRWYPGATTARRQLDAAASALAGCGTYTLTWPDGDQARQTVTPHGSAGLGSASWHATVSVTYEAVTVRETLVLVVVRNSLVVLSHLSTPPAPPRPQTLSLAAQAAARVP